MPVNLYQNQYLRNDHKAIVKEYADDKFNHSLSDITVSTEGNGNEREYFLTVLDWCFSYTCIEERNFDRDHLKHQIKEAWGR